MGPLKRKSESNLLEEVPKDEPGAINENPPVKKLKQKHQDKETLKVKPEKVIEEKNENSNKDRSTELLDEATAGDDEGGKRKRHGRKRKKKCYTEILKQMEFYFSDANIAKSAFMQVRFYHTSLDTVNMQFGAWKWKISSNLAFSLTFYNNNKIPLIYAQLTYSKMQGYGVSYYVTTRGST